MNITSSVKKKVVQRCPMKGVTTLSNESCIKITPVLYACYITRPYNIF